jgi:hypothetical protein
MALLSINAGGASGGFLYNSSLAKTRVCITAETPDFDTAFIRQWQDEGFEVMYLPYNGGGKEYTSQLKSVKEGLGVGVNYAVIGGRPCVPSTRTLEGIKLTGNSIR